MYNRHYWTFQNTKSHPKVAQQDIDELTNLSAGLLAFEKAFCTTHGERTPVFRILSMINAQITEQIAIIERYLIDNPYTEKKNEDDIPF